MNYEKNVNTIDVNDPDFLWDTSDRNDPDYYIKCSLNDVKLGVRCYTLEESFERGRKLLIKEGLRQGYTLEELERMEREIELELANEV
jgi:hypothetical protein